MRYEYGGLIRVIPPGGRTLTGQMGQQTQDGDVVIHVHSHQIEAPAQVLRDEGWQVPEIETVVGGGPVGARPEMSFAEDAKAIVDALMNDEERDAVRVSFPPREVPVKRDPMGMRPRRAGQRAACPHCGSFGHVGAACPRMQGPAPGRGQDFRHLGYGPR